MPWGIRLPSDEGVAKCIGPEPCACAREGTGDASVEECIGQPSAAREASRESRCALVFPRLINPMPQVAVDTPGDTDARV